MAKEVDQDNSVGEDNYTFSYKAEDVQSHNCIICGEEITEEDFEYEDYFTIFRGHSEEAFAGYGCFKCVKKQEIEL